MSKMRAEAEADFGSGELWLRVAVNWRKIAITLIDQFSDSSQPLRGAYDHSSGHGSQKKRKSELGKAAPIFSSRADGVRRCGSTLGSHEGNLQQFKSAANLVSAQW